MVDVSMNSPMSTHLSLFTHINAWYQRCPSVSHADPNKKADYTFAILFHNLETMPCSSQTSQPTKQVKPNSNRKQIIASQQLSLSGIPGAAG